MPFSIFSIFLDRCELAAPARIRFLNRHLAQHSQIVLGIVYSLSVENKIKIREVIVDVDFEVVHYFSNQLTTLVRFVGFDCSGCTSFILQKL